MSNAVIKLRKANIEDGPLTLWLEEVCMKDYATSLWGSWRPSTTLEKIDLTGHEIIEFHEEAVGCIATFIDKNCLRVSKLYVSPNFQSRGIGSQVVEEIAERARALNLPIRLDVLTTNPALKFYLREGFLVETENTERRTLIKYN